MRDALRIAESRGARLGVLAYDDPGGLGGLGGLDGLDGLGGLDEADGDGKPVPEPELTARGPVPSSGDDT
ncbi:hypothetical protein ACWCQ0_05480 [Streptomyces massasporeus]|uniref:hypothetical protein n=1 Tax=Streptomyces massasporeus TaxID=67324 RepID=UPI0033CC5060